MEFLRRDADDGELMVVERKRLADRIKLTSEAPLPECVTDYRYRGGQTVVACDHQAPGDGCDPEQVIVVAGDHRAIHLLHLAADADSEIVGGIRRDTGERLGQ